MDIRFTDRALKILTLANEETNRFNHKYIGTEHILLGIIKEGNGVAANVLKNLNSDPNNLRIAVEQSFACVPSKVLEITQHPQTPQVKMVLQDAMEEAGTFNHNYYGTEHILLGLLRDKESIAAEVLMNASVTLDKARTEILSLLGPGMSSPPDSQQADKTRREGEIARMEIEAMSRRIS